MFSLEYMELKLLWHSTGLMSRELAAYVKLILGVDISQKMVDQFNLRVANQGTDPSKMRAVSVELKGTDEELDGLKFDVTIVRP